MLLSASRRAAFVFLVGVSPGSAVAQTRGAEPRPWWWEAEQRLERAMKADGLGRAIVIEAPKFPSSTGTRIERHSLQPQVEWAHGERRGDFFGPVRTAVTVAWTTGRESVGRLVIEGPFNDQTCRFEGDVAADRITVSGNGVCAGQPVAFRACIDRGERDAPSPCEKK